MKFTLPQFEVPYQDHMDRKKTVSVAAYSMQSAVKTINLQQVIEKTDVMLKIPAKVPMANDPRWAAKPFGAANTVEHSACIALVSKIVMDYFGYRVAVTTLVDEIVAKGYRSWKFQNLPTTMVFPEVNLQEIKQKFTDNEAIEKARNLEELYEVTGKPVGIGGSPFVIDNIVNQYAKRKIRIYRDTRLYSVSEIISNLKKGIIVPVRVSNSIYHDDSNRKEGHYVTLFGIREGNAYVLDTSVKENGGVKVLPFERLLAAMVEDKNLICAWDLSPMVR